jgi:hypothetical protein
LAYRGLPGVNPTYGAAAVCSIFGKDRILRVMGQADPNLSSQRCFGFRCEQTRIAILFCDDQGIVLLILIISLFCFRNLAATRERRNKLFT